MKLYTSGRICGHCGREMTLSPAGRFVKHNLAHREVDQYGRVRWTVTGSRCDGSGLTPELSVKFSKLTRIVCAECGKEVSVTSEGRNLWRHKHQPQGSKWSPACYGSGWTLAVNIMNLEKKLRQEREERAKADAQRQSDHNAAAAGGGAGGQAGDGRSVGGGFAVGVNSPEAAAGIRATGAAGGGVPDAGQLRQGGQDAPTPAPEAAGVEPQSPSYRMCACCKGTWQCGRSGRTGLWLCAACWDRCIKQGTESINDYRRAWQAEPVVLTTQLQYRVMYRAGSSISYETVGEWRDVHPEYSVGLAGSACRLQFRRKPAKTDAEILAAARDWLAHQDETPRASVEVVTTLSQQYMKIVRILRGEF